MKHLKKYEQNSVPDFKKYIIWRYCNGYAIFELLGGILDNEIKLKYLYQYYDDTEKIIKTDIGEENSNMSLSIDDNIVNNYKKFCIYQSNNLEDCLNVLKSLGISKKYNI